MKRKLILSVFILAVLGSSIIQAQSAFKLRFKDEVRIENNPGYTFFMGDDAADFRTSVKGFGSGLFDIFNTRQSMEFLQLGFKRANLSLGVGMAVNKYRFSDNLVFSLDDQGVVNYEKDPDDTHDYVNTFFGYGKSKLVNASVYVPLNLNLHLGKNIVFSAGGFFDYSFYTKQKRKYKVGDEKVKVLITPSEMREYPINKVKYGIHAGLYHKKWNKGVSFSYYLTPFFQEGMGPDLNEARVTFSYSFISLRKLMTHGR